jgi:hypothetical protein
MSNTVHARYLLIRLALRKSGAWFRQCKLEVQYNGDLGPNTLAAMLELTNYHFVFEEENTKEAEQCSSSFLLFPLLNCN